MTPRADRSPSTVGRLLAAVPVAWRHDWPFRIALLLALLATAVLLLHATARPAFVLR